MEKGFWLNGWHDEEVMRMEMVGWLGGIGIGLLEERYVSRYSLMEMGCHTGMESMWTAKTWEMHAAFEILWIWFVVLSVDYMVVI